MFDWFEKFVKDLIWKSLEDSFGSLAAKSEDELKSYLNKLKPEEILSESPLIKVLGVDDFNNTITILIRGNVPLFKGIQSVFVRMEVIISKGDPKRIVGWPTVMCELTIGNEGLTEKPTDRLYLVKLGLGYEHDTWVGRGVLKILPPLGFGIDISLGGLDKDGVVLGFGATLGSRVPVPIPLGSTGLALSYLGGDFAYNFIARITNIDKTPLTQPPDAMAYVRWARISSDLDRWESSRDPINKTAAGVCLRCQLVDVATSGTVVQIDPLGMAILTPGPVFVFGGTGKMLKTNSAKIEGYMAVDITSASLAMGLAAELKFPASGSFIDGKGTVDAFFSFSDPSLFYLNVGSQESPIRVKILKGLFGADVFLMIDNKRTHFGAAISIGGELSWWIITLIARARGGFSALVGYNPWQLAGSVKIWGEVGIRIWKFKFLLTAGVEFIGHTPQPTKFQGQLSYKLDLPWPIPDVEGSCLFPMLPIPIEGPLLASPMMIGEAHWGEDP